MLRWNLWRSSHGMEDLWIKFRVILTINHHWPSTIINHYITQPTVIQGSIFSRSIPRLDHRSGKKSVEKRSAWSCAAVLRVCSEHRRENMWRISRECPAEPTLNSAFCVQQLFWSKNWERWPWLRLKIVEYPPQKFDHHRLSRPHLTRNACFDFYSPEGWAHPNWLLLGSCTLDPLV